jgi:predicted nucleic acid-binding Zn ribbon protein
MTTVCEYCGKEVPGPERICNDKCREYLARVRRYDKGQMDYFAAERRKAAGLTPGKEPE